MLDPLTVISSSLGIPSALICISDKVVGWKDRIDYKRNPWKTHRDLQEQFWKVQEKARYKLDFYVNCLKNDDEREKCLEALKEIRHENALSWYINEYSREDLIFRDMDRLIYETEALQKRYESNLIAQQLADKYTAFFKEELCHYEELQRWYAFCEQGNIIDECDEIKRIVLISNETIHQVLKNTDYIEEKIDRSEHVSNEIRNAFNSIMLCLAVSFVGTGVAFLIGMLMNVELSGIFIIGIPISFIISDLSVCAFRSKQVINLVSRKMEWYISSRERRMYISIELILSIMLQIIIAFTCIYIILHIFNTNGENGNIEFWLTALASGSIMIQLLREYQHIKRKKE